MRWGRYRYFGSRPTNWLNVSCGAQARLWVKPLGNSSATADRFRDRVWLLPCSTLSPRRAGLPRSCAGKVSTLSKSGSERRAQKRRGFTRGWANYVMASGAGDRHGIAALGQTFADEGCVGRPGAAVALLPSAFSQVFVIFLLVDTLHVHDGRGKVQLRVDAAGKCECKKYSN